MSTKKYRQWQGDCWHYWGWIEDEYGGHFVGPFAGTIKGTVKPQDSQQYTGLTDKNERETWEGDIVRHSETLGIIKPGVGGQRIKWLGDKNGHLNTVLAVWPGEWIEVIGDIYTTPELLST